MNERHLLANDITRVFLDDDYNQICALDGFNLEVNHGEIVALIGPSGCGKSSFLRLVAGLDVPQQGIIEFNGCKIEGTDPERGFVFQDSSLFPWMTVFDNIAFGLKLDHSDKLDKRKVQDMIDLMGLQGFEKAYPHQISGGMAARVSLARTFILQPGVILLDEPLSALDAFTRATIQDEILKMWKINEPIVILVTHDVEEALYLSDRVVVMTPRPGRVSGELSVDMQHPRDRTSEEFVAKRKKVLEMLEF